MSPIRASGANRTSARGEDAAERLRVTGSFVLNDAGQQSVWLRQLVTGQELQIVPPGRTDIYGLTFTRDGRTLISGSTDLTIREWPIATKK